MPSDHGDSDGNRLRRSLISPRTMVRLLVVGRVVGVELHYRRVWGALVLLGGQLVCRVLLVRHALRWGNRMLLPRSKDLVNRLGALSGASGVYLNPPPVPCPWARARHVGLPDGLVMVAGDKVGQAARSDVGSESLTGVGVGSSDL